MLGNAVNLGGDHFWEDNNNSWSPTAAPFTLAVAGRRAVTNLDRPMLSLNRGTTDNHFYHLRTDNAGNIELISQAGGAGTRETESLAGATEGVWFFWGGGIDSSDNFFVWSDTNQQSTSHTGRAIPSGIDSVAFATLRGGGTPMVGDLLYEAIWSVALTVREQTALGKGIHPFMIRPDALLTFIIWVGTTPIVLIGPAILTETTGTIVKVASGLHVLQPSSQILQFPPAAAVVDFLPLFDKPTNVLLRM